MARGLQGLHVHVEGLSCSSSLLFTAHDDYVLRLFHAHQLELCKMGSLTAAEDGGFIDTDVLMADFARRVALLFLLLPNHHGLELKAFISSWRSCVAYSQIGP